MLGCRGVGAPLGEAGAGLLPSAPARAEDGGQVERVVVLGCRRSGNMVLEREGRGGAG